MKLYVGLGNPGTKYEHTRHNLGAMIIARFIEKKSLSLKNQPKLSAQIAEYHKTFFALTNEYMNNSGIAVQKIAHYYKIDPQDICIIHDDLDLSVGDHRVQFDRGPAGHNGIKSIIEHLGTQAFHRIRVGIGKPQNNIPVEDFVLLPFTPDEKNIITKTIEKIVDDIESGR